MKIVLSDGERLLGTTLERWGYEVEIVADSADAIKRFRAPDPPKLAVLDWEMRTLSGPEICKKLREDTIEPYIYVILLTTNSKKDDLLEALEFGADDYLIKPFDGYELRAKLTVAKRILALQDRLVTMREDLRMQASHDSMTGLWNRQASLTTLAGELNRASREQKAVGVIMVDVDHFKRVNDTYGHPAGDAVLKEVAGRLQRAVRPYDTVARYGGEEFLIITPGCSGAALEERAQQIRASIKNQPIQTGNETLRTTVSVGAGAVSGDNPSITHDIPSILRAVDDALYRAKGAGRDRVEIAII